MALALTHPLQSSLQMRNVLDPGMFRRRKQEQRQYTSLHLFISFLFYGNAFNKFLIIREYELFIKTRSNQKYMYTCT